MTPSERLERLVALDAEQSTIEAVADWAIAEHGWRPCQLYVSDGEVDGKPVSSVQPGYFRQWTSMSVCPSA